MKTNLDSNSVNLKQNTNRVSEEFSDKSSQEILEVKNSSRIKKTIETLV